MNSPSPLCQYRMQVHHIHQETPDVWTLSLINHDVYPYQPGQFALVSIANSDRLRAYTLSSSPGHSQFISLTVRRVVGGQGSHWLTDQVKPGDYLWLSSAQGEFSCQQEQADRYLFLAAGCGVTPIMSMCRWLVAERPEADVQVIYCVRTPEDIIFADTWRSLDNRLRLTVYTERGGGATHQPGRLHLAALRAEVPDIAARTVMICGPAPWMAQQQADVQALGAVKVLLERFHTPAPVLSNGRFTLTRTRPLATLDAPVGVSLLAALEAGQWPITAACRAGVCGCCKTRITAGPYHSTSTQTLNENEIADGYVLACSCYPDGDIVMV
ncbi:NADH oxidoreductase [Acerihabitans sp. TG2]|uniref:NADH oxidoreductase n=1 Tax=Acerihabitans sp. TG2 TaxID=3096008 RepID=UPI002B23E6B5|nr:NADH oxidoreductase [Acerihabitans sp. TG2]MEA9391905.1 NADH oxidoreductase [Acerihabitans sp. TG2]